MAKLTLTDVVQGFQSVAKINANNDAIEAALENTLSRDGTTPNTMSADLDMNTNKIQNLEAPAASNDAARLIDVTNLISVTNIVAPSLTGNADKVLVTDGTVTAWVDADGIKYNAQGNIIATKVGDAIDELDTEKAGIAIANTFTAAQTFQKPINYIAMGGAVNVYTATLVPAIASYQTGAVYNLSTSTINTTTTPTININGLGAKTVVNIVGSALIAGEINGYHTFQYDGTNLRLLNPAILISPSFSVTLGGINQYNITGTSKILWTTEEFDTNSDFDNSSNYRLTPTVKGKYLLSATVSFGNANTGQGVTLFLYKNGSSYKTAGIPYHEAGVSSTSPVNSITVTAVVDANGSTDYFEIFANNETVNTMDVLGATTYTHWTGCKVSN